MKLRGIVNKVIDTEKVAIMEIMQPQEITVVLFKNEDKTIQIKDGNEVEVIGRVGEYEGKLQIVADRLRVVR